MFKNQNMNCAAHMSVRTVGTGNTKNIEYNVPTKKYQICITIKIIICNTKL